MQNISLIVFMLINVEVTLDILSVFIHSGCYDKISQTIGLLTIEIYTLYWSW